MKRIDNLLPTAMAELLESKLTFKKGGVPAILKEYDGYVASFAPSVITAGLKATLSFYADRHKIKDPKDVKPDFSIKSVEPRRIHVLNILFAIYQKNGGQLSGSDLLDIALDKNRNDDELRQFKRDLIDAAIALKLCLRNFKQEEKPPTIVPNTTEP